MALPSILLLLAFVGGVFATVGFTLVLAIGPDPSTTTPRWAAIVGAVSAAVAAARRLASLEHVSAFRSRLPRAPPRLRRSPSACWSRRSARTMPKSQEHHPRLRAAARHRHVPVRDVVGRLRPRSPYPPVRRRLLAASAGSADDRAPGLHLARPERRQRQHRRGPRRGPLYVVLGITALAIDRRALLVSALAYVLYALHGAVPASSERSSSMSR